MSCSTNEKAANLHRNELVRETLIHKINSSSCRLIYIQAGAGYGKTTLLSQIASAVPNCVWLNVSSECDFFSFTDKLIRAVHHTFPSYEFVLSEYFAFEEKEKLLLTEFTTSLEKLNNSFTLILDNLHTIKGKSLRAFLFSLLEAIPENIRIIISSREAPWKDLLYLCRKLSFLEIRQNELAFTRSETAFLLGTDSEQLYEITEGWPLAVMSCKMLLENGVTPSEIPSQETEAQYTFLFQECLNYLPSEVVEFLISSACLDYFDPFLLDTLLMKNNSGTILENLVLRNLFTSKGMNGQYRYHALFKEFLLKKTKLSDRNIILKKAAEYYFQKQLYPVAAEYAIRTHDMELLQKIILNCYKEYMRNGRFHDLRIWFEAIDKVNSANIRIFVAKGAYLSSIGNFTGAKACLDTAIPLISEDNRELYFEAMLHKARVYRNFISFEASNQLLDEIIQKLDNHTSELAYDVLIEKLYNLCWNSQINEAYSLALECIEACARAGSLKIRDWFKRYLSAIYFFMGRMKESIEYYENSLELPENERNYLDVHTIGIYAAKAYQMMGEREKSIKLLDDELMKLKSTGKYEEMWFGYLFAAEIHYQNSFIDSMNGIPVNYEITKHYFSLAFEYAPLYRKTDYQMQWVKMLKLTYSLIFSSVVPEENIQEMFTTLNQSSDYLKSIILARLFGYYAAVGDYPNALKCAKRCVEVGEASNMRLHSTLAYGILARASLESGNTVTAASTIKRYLEQCHELGIYEYFRMKKQYEPLVKFAFNNSIALDAVHSIMDFADYSVKKAYVKTFGGFTIFPYDNRKTPLKMRTRKERELLLFLLNAGSQGATKDQIHYSIWSESESDDIKKLIGVNLCQLKKDLLYLGINDAVVCTEKHYRIISDVIECDFELFEEIAARFELNPTREDAIRLISLYTGEFLSDFEAFWATPKRLRYNDVYEKAVTLCQ